ncbi:MAG: RdgB/HAM1 family non-canonical purine NTP pyrophosphatase [Spirochaetaceae bacterium]|nr:RdgB/HAM1 family non-canonical purine NTP pyrophosphatase [Spirochaetaceae bacterium]
MKIVLASGNINKKKEFAAIFREHTLLLPADIGIAFSHEETGATFLENALGKAQTLRRMMKEEGTEILPVISDDSGISLPALGGEPGVYSARYGQTGTAELTDNDRNRLLLSRMAGIQDRRAFFVCALVFLDGEYRFFAAQETWEGVLAENPAGAGGFGYDPLLYLPEQGRTVAQLPAEEKNRVSHRAKAAMAVKNLIEKAYPLSTEMAHNGTQ